MSWNKGLHYLLKEKTTLVCETCKKGFEVWPYLQKRRFCSRECMITWRSKEIKNGKISLKNLYKFAEKENNPNWKGGVTPINELLRRTEDYKKWRQAVFERDNYTCVWCNRKGGDLNADHIKQFALYPKLRLELSNGRTLCVECHRKTFIFYRNQHTQGAFL